MSTTSPIITVTSATARRFRFSSFVHGGVLNEGDVSAPMIGPMPAKDVEKIHTISPCEISDLQRSPTDSAHSRCLTGRKVSIDGADLVDVSDDDEVECIASVHEDDDEAVEFVCQVANADLCESDSDVEIVSEIRLRASNKKQLRKQQKQKQQKTAQQKTAQQKTEQQKIEQQQECSITGRGKKRFEREINVQKDSAKEIDSCSSLVKGKKIRSLQDSSMEQDPNLIQSDRHESSKENEMDKECIVMTQHQQKHCEKCNVTVPEYEFAAHLSSISHQIEERSPSPPILEFGIPASNIGRKLLKKIGWSEEGGLGPDGKGRLYPIPVFYKDDRKGIGASGTGKKTVESLRHVLHLSQSQRKYVLPVPPKQINSRERTTHENRGVKPFNESLFRKYLAS